MKIKRILIALVLIFSLLPLSPTVRAESSEDLFRQMINYYHRHQGAGRADIERLLQQLETIDADAAVQWRELMDSWHRANKEIDFGSNTLPDNLPDDDSLCIVVMGYQLGPGGKMQDELVCRLEIALTAAQQYPNAYILVTGGATGSGSYATEAGRMANWLTYKGISPERIIQDTLSYSTEANAINGLKILKSSYPQVKHLALITSDYHMIRSHLVFAARQAAVGGDIIDIVAHACYATKNSTHMDITVQAELIALMLGLDIDGMKKPALSQVTGLTLTGSTSTSQGDSLGLTAIAEYNTGFSRDVTADTQFTGFDPHTPGTQIVDASYTENGITVSDVIGVEVIAAETEVVIAPTEVEMEIIPQTVDTPAEEKQFAWLVGAALVLLIILLVLLYELWQQYQRIQRRKRRRRKRMNLE